MAKAYQERTKNFTTISERHALRELEGCTSWRHFVVHQDRGWLLNAFTKIREQVEKVREAEKGEKDVCEAEVKELLSMFDETRLNFLGDEKK